MITSSLTLSITLAASPATSATSTGPRYKFQNKNNSPVNGKIDPRYSIITTKRVAGERNLPLLCVVLATWPKRFEFGSQKMRSKQSTTLFRLPKPRRSMAAAFQSGSGGENCGALGEDAAFGESDSLSTPKGRVHKTISPEKRKIRLWNWDIVRLTWDFNLYRVNSTFAFATQIRLQVCWARGDICVAK